MKFTIRGKKLEVTDAIKAYVEEKIGRLDKYFENPENISANVLMRLSGNDQEDIFVHYSAILSEGYKTLVEGQYVKFDLVRTDKGLQAKNVIELKDALV